MRSLIVIVSLALLPLMTVPGHASVVDTTELLTTDSGQTPSVDSQRRRDVQQRLLELGVEPAEAARRAQQMTDEEITQLHTRMDELPAGQGISTTNLLLIIIILILLL